MVIDTDANYFYISLYQMSSRMQCSAEQALLEILENTSAGPFSLEMPTCLSLSEGVKKLTAAETLQSQKKYKF